MNANERWDAVRRRDRAADGRFVFAVRTTGVFCRPSCAARRPRRDNVLFFDRPASAEGAGFRACRRCRPNDAGAQDARFVARVREALAAGDDAPAALRSLAGALQLTPSQLVRRFRRLTGVTPREMRAADRVAALKSALRKGAPVTDALYEAGYSSSSRLYERAAERLGMTPASYAKGGRGVAIAWDVAPCALGHVLVAATARGVAAVTLGDDARALEAALRAEFPDARLARDPAAVAPWMEAVRRGAEGAGVPAEVPLDVRATAFQWQVWRYLRRLGPGQTRTYAEVARDLGRPGAARAVAAACAANHAALVVPCHRVVPAGGGAGGYRWGAGRKERVLAAERGARSR